MFFGKILLLLDILLVALNSMGQNLRIFRIISCFLGCLFCLLFALIVWVILFLGCFCWFCCFLYLCLGYLASILTLIYNTTKIATNTNPTYPSPTARNTYPHNTDMT
jgi:hypothetical protein